MPASRSRRPSSASCSTTTATNVLVTLPMFHATSRSTGPLAGSTVGVPAAASVIVPSASRSAMRAPTNSPAAWWSSRMSCSIVRRAPVGCASSPSTGGEAPAATDETAPATRTDPATSPMAAVSCRMVAVVCRCIPTIVSPSPRRIVGRRGERSATRSPPRDGPTGAGVLLEEDAAWCRQIEPRRDRPRLVGEHHELGAVARVELRQQPAHVGLRRGRARRTARSAISALERPRATSASTSRSRSVSTSSGARRRPTSGSGRRANSSISRRVTRGASSASPAATTRTAASRSSGRVSLSRKPLAPARSAVEDVLVEVEGGQDEHPGAAERASTR